MDPDIALTLPFPRFTRLKKKKIHSHWEKKKGIYFITNITWSLPQLVVKQR